MDPNIAHILLDTAEKNNKPDTIMPDQSRFEPSVMVDMFPGPAVLVDGDMNVHHHNVFAKSLLTPFENGEAFLKKMISRCLANSCPDAQKIALEDGEGIRHYDLYALPLQENNQKTAPLVFLFGRETTVEHNLTDALVNSRQMFKDLVSCSADFAWETDYYGNFIYASPRGILGYTAFELNGRNSQEMIIGDSDNNPFATMEKINEMELWLTRADGAMACLLISAVPVLNDQVEWKGARGVCRDITHIREREATLRRSHKREHVLDRIVATIRNMVTPADMLENALGATMEGIEADYSCLIQKVTHADGSFKAVVRQQKGELADEDMIYSLCQKAMALWVSPEDARPPRTQTLQIGPCQILTGLTRHHGTDNGAIFLIRDKAKTWHEDEIYLFDGITTHLGIAVEQLVTYEELERRAFTDELTGLLNRRAFDAEVTKRLHNQQRSRKTGALLYLDLDNFKNVNDSKGHACGDMILQKLSRIIDDNIRVGDYAARLGGDEFAIWLDEISEKEAALKAHNFVVAGAGLARLANVDGPQLSLSIGVAICRPEDQDSLDGLMKKADEALYQAKAAGKSASVIYDPKERKENPDA